ncbi:ornithine decarboxylase antizyme [Histoplasma capsulatum var. duboisii H88]|uniref:Ornithine decarboxylase antizyme n=1 Tax=Ajellomyces capsulatus (strain H88) TaxID=544711 RepID=A0A8A1LWP5_AJEC8|nr:ornithine decarboxylase antizyme [Histoplasma capsulatum var. duboisii H88]
MIASSAGAPQSPAVAHHLRSLGVGSDPSQPSPQKIFNEIIHKIPTIQKFTEIIYENISPSDGALICQSLEASEHVERRNIRVNFNAFTRTLRIRIMPTELHDAHQRWAIDALVEWTQDGLLSREEQRALDAGVGTNFFFRADTDDFPSIVMESGWSESLPYLRADKDLWIKGNNFVQLVILLKCITSLEDE